MQKDLAQALLNLGMHDALHVASLLARAIREKKHNTELSPEVSLLRRLVELANEENARILKQETALSAV